MGGERDRAAAAVGGSWLLQWHVGGRSIVLHLSGGVEGGRLHEKRLHGHERIAVRRQGIMHQWPDGCSGLWCAGLAVMSVLLCSCLGRAAREVEEL